MNLKHFLKIIMAVATILLAGCAPRITNLTSEQIPQNVSGIYTMTMTVSSEDGSIVDGSYAPEIVIGGSREPMRRSELGPRTFEYDFAMPEGISEARYYYILNYDVNYSGTESPRQITSDLYQFQLTNRYVITMESNRGPVGASIPVVGRGFSEFDTIMIGGIDAETIYASPQSLNFIVPALPSGEAYPVELVSGNGYIPIGYFQVDGSKLKVYPESISISSGERTVIIFGIDSVAPEGGLPIDVTTDRPECIIMPEVLIPAGAQTVSVPIEGGQGGVGMLVASAPGFMDLEIPLEVFGGATASTQVETVTSSSRIVTTPAGETVVVDESGQIIGTAIPASDDFGAQTAGDEDFILIEEDINIIEVVE